MGWWSDLFLPKPFNQGYLPSKDGHEVFFMEFGNPQGKPVLVFHGGPGGAMSCRAVKLFKKKYRVILFDQRGCGNSKPLGKLEYNTTQDLLDDATRLLSFLNIESKVILRGGSWGSSLALLWAIQNPQRVERLLLSQIFLADEEAACWENSEAALFYPEFVEQMQEQARSADLAKYYDGLICSDDLENQLKAVNTYGIWEIIRSSLTPCWGNRTEISEEELASQKIYIHYAANDFWLKKNEIIKGLEKISNIPTLIVHNRLDFVCPLKGAYQLHKNLSNSKLIIVPGQGHFGGILADTIKKEIRRVLK